MVDARETGLVRLLVVDPEVLDLALVLRGSMVEDYRIKSQVYKHRVNFAFCKLMKAAEVTRRPTLERYVQR